MFTMVQSSQGTLPRHLKDKQEKKVVCNSAKLEMLSSQLQLKNLTLQDINTGLRHNRIKNTSSKIKHIQMPRLVQTEALYGGHRGLYCKSEAMF